LISERKAHGVALNYLKLIIKGLIRKVILALCIFHRLVTLFLKYLNKKPLLKKRLVISAKMLERRLEVNKPAKVTKQKNVFMTPSSEKIYIDIKNTIEEYGLHR